MKHDEDDMELLADAVFEELESEAAQCQSSAPCGAAACSAASNSPTGHQARNLRRASMQDRPLGPSGTAPAIQPQARTLVTTPVTWSRRVTTVMSPPCSRS
jgi:hypothetical protein